MTGFDRRSHFAVPVFAQRIDGFDEHREALAQWVAEVHASSAGIAASNRGGWHSARDLHRAGSPVAVWLVDAIASFARDAIGAHYGGRTVSVRVNELWANVAPRGAWHAPHEHFPAHWSGVLYVSAEHSVASAENDDRAGRIEFSSPIPLARAFGLPGSVLYTPEDGKALLFPGPLVHLVHPHASDTPRVSLSFNVDVVTVT